MDEIYLNYQKFVNKNSRLTEGAKRKISTRLKSFTEEELVQAMMKFSKNTWWMEHNKHRGVAWFFHSDDRIDQFLNMESEKKRKVIIV